MSPINLGKWKMLGAWPRAASRRWGGENPNQIGLRRDKCDGEMEAVTTGKCCKKFNCKRECLKGGFTMGAIKVCLCANVDAVCWSKRKIDVTHLSLPLAPKSRVFWKRFYFMLEPLPFLLVYNYFRVENISSSFDCKKCSDVRSTGQEFQDCLYLYSIHCG